MKNCRLDAIGVGGGFDPLNPSWSWCVTILLCCTDTPGWIIVWKFCSFGDPFPG